MAAEVSFSIASPGGPHTVTIAYERAGAGEPLLLLHGIGHHRQAWDPVLKILAAEHDVIAVDLPGFGASPALPDGLAYHLSTVVQALDGLCEALEIERPHVAGNSLGGLLALELGREKLVRSVTALSPGGFWSAAERRYAFGTLLAMRQGARLLPLPVIERLSTSVAGRATLTSTIYARPWRRSPEAASPRRSRCPRDHGLRRHADGRARRPLPRRRDGPAGDRRLGHPGPAAPAPPGRPRQAHHPPARASCGSRAAVTSR